MCHVWTMPRISFENIKVWDSPTYCNILLPFRPLCARILCQRCGFVSCGPVINYCALRIIRQHRFKFFPPANSSQKSVSWPFSASWPAAFVSLRLFPTSSKSAAWHLCYSVASVPSLHLALRCSALHCNEHPSPRYKFQVPCCTRQGFGVNSIQKGRIRWIPNEFFLLLILLSD